MLDGERLVSDDDHVPGRDLVAQQPLQRRVDPVAEVEVVQFGADGCGDAGSLGCDDRSDASIIGGFAAVDIGRTGGCDRRVSVDRPMSLPLDDA